MTRSCTCAEKLAIFKTPPRNSNAASATLKDPMSPEAVRDTASFLEDVNFLQEPNDNESQKDISPIHPAQKLTFENSARVVAETYGKNANESLSNALMFLSEACSLSNTDAPLQHVMSPSTTKRMSRI